jgi:hypothetical protein
MIAIVTACLAAGCFDSHGDGDDAGVPPSGDGGPGWTDCWAALSGASHGDACSFEGACGYPGCGEEPSEQATCVGGRVRFITPICTRAWWTSCDEFLESGWGTAGDDCDASSFGVCSRDSGDCCRESIFCDDAGTVQMLEACADCELAWCEDYVEPGPGASTCATSADCAGGVPCMPTDAPRICGICFPTPHECDSAADCGGSTVCVSERFDCGCDGDEGTVCREACTEGSCAEGFVCTSAGTCEAIDCHDGYACPSNTACIDVTSPGAIIDVHGCVRRGCDVDTDCECGVCFEGICRSGPGVCMIFAP